MGITDTNFNKETARLRNEQLKELAAEINKPKESDKLVVVILAAGLGKRMKSPDKPKVMFEVLGKPMIDYVLELALKLNPEKIIPIVGHHKEKVIHHLNHKYSNNSIYYVVQEKQLGTGHAVMQAQELLAGFSGNVLILSGDVPMLSIETLMSLIETHISGNFKATLLTAHFSNPSGYGRIIRDKDGRFVKIVEEKDATEEEKSVKEINPAIYIVNSQTLFDSLKKISPDNKQKEYYLTDIFLHIPSDKTGLLMIDNELEVTGINSVEQLRGIEIALSNSDDI